MFDVFQISSSILEACVIAVLHKGDAYGYTLTQSVRQRIGISESTLYPVLRRLEKEGHLITYEEKQSGRLRRYYRLTESGMLEYEKNKQKWAEYCQRIESILYDNNQDQKEEKNETL